MKKIDVKENEQVKIGPFKLLLRMIWNEDDIEAKWEEEPNRKALEEALERVDKMAPKTEPVLTGKKGKTRKNSELNKNNFNCCFLKSKKYIASKSNFQLTELISYFIVCLRDELKKGERMHAK